MKKSSSNIPSGYKPSPLGPIPEDWEVKRLGEICTHFKSGNTITSKEINEDGLYPVYGGNGLRGYSNTFTHEGDFILIGRQGALCGNINYVEGRNYISEHAIAVQTDENMQWLKYKLENWNLNRFSESSAQPGLSVEKLVRYKLVIPTRLEQNKIADILQLWDTAIAKQTTLIEKLTLRKRGLMQQLLTGKKRLKGFCGEWKKIKFKEIFQRKTQTVNDSSNIQVLSVTKEGIVSQKEYFNKEIASDDTSKYLLVEKGDLAMSGLNFWMGSCHILTQYKKGIISPAYKVFSIRDGFSIEYIVNFVQSYNFKSSLLGSSVIGASIVRRNLDLEMLEEWTYSLPSLPEQEAISDILTYADKEIEIQKQKLAAMQAQKKGLMQVLLTGKKRIISI